MRTATSLTSTSSLMHWHWQRCHLCSRASQTLPGCPGQHAAHLGRVNEARGDDCTSKKEWPLPLSSLGGLRGLASSGYRLLSSGGSGYLQLPDVRVGSLHRQRMHCVQHPQLLQGPAGMESGLMSVPGQVGPRLCSMTKPVPWADVGYAYSSGLQQVAVQHLLRLSIGSAGRLRASSEACAGRRCPSS